MEVAVKEEREQKYKLFWKDGTEEIVEGSEVSVGFCKAGYDHSSIELLDHYVTLPEEVAK